MKTVDITIHDCIHVLSYNRGLSIIKERSLIVQDTMLWELCCTFDQPILVLLGLLG